MYTSYRLILSFIFTAGMFALLMVLILVALLVKHKAIGKSAVLSSLRNFIICFFCIVLLYYLTSYRGIYSGIFQRSAPARLAECGLFILRDYFWFVFIRIHLQERGRARPGFDRISNWILLIFFVLFAISSTLLMDRTYMVASLGGKVFAIGVEITSFFAISTLNLLYALAIRESGCGKQTRNFVLAVSALLVGNRLVDCMVTVRLAGGRMTYEIESFYYDPTSVLMILTAICTLAYLFFHDFSPIYFREKTEQEPSDEDVLELLAQECGLSKREREISLLIFQGDSYETIAEQLYISKLTVKKHVHNLYEKMDVSKRMDLINLVRDRKIQEKQK